MTDILRRPINSNIEETAKQVIPFSYENANAHIERKRISQEQLQHEYDYFLAQQILESLLKNDMVTEDEFNRITKLNRISFSPALAQVM